MDNTIFYYYTDGTQQFGPFEKEVLRTFNIQPGTLVWRQGLENWVPARTLPDLSDLFYNNIQPVPPRTSASFGYSRTPNYITNQPPVIKLRTRRGLLKYIIFTILTLGIYHIVVFSHISSEINAIASKHDHRHTMHYCLVFFLLSWLTLGIYPLVWWSNICSRMGTELVTRRIKYSFGAGYFWLWNILGSLILVGPFIFTYKFFKSMNLLAKDYNVNG